MYGRGIYFASDPGYSAKPPYCMPDANGLKYIFYARVLTGNFTLGAKDMVGKPAMNAEGTQRYDCTVNDMDNPSIFVIYADEQAYPDYLVTFK